MPKERDTTALAKTAPESALPRGRFLLTFTAHALPPLIRLLPVHDKLTLLLGSNGGADGCGGRGHLPLGSVGGGAGRYHAAGAGVAHEGVAERDGRLTLDFEDAEGQRLSLVDDGGRGEGHVWAKSSVPAEDQIRGLIAMQDLGAFVQLDSRAYRFDIVLRGHRATLFENPVQTTSENAK